MRPAGVKHLVSAVNAEAVPHVRVLTLKGNYLAHLPSGQTDTAPISELLSTGSLKELEKLDLSENRVFDGTDSQLLAASSAVPGRFPKLRRLDLGSTDVFEEGCMASGELAAFATALGVGGLPSFEELVIPDGGSYWNPNPEGVVAFSNALSSGHLSQLRWLTLQARYDMTGEAFAGLCRSLATGNVSLLQSLDLDMCNDDTTEGVGALAEGIWGRKLSLLVSFRLALCNVNGLAVSGLGLALGGGGCPSLQKLDLKWWEEGDEGMGGLAEGLGGGRLSSLRDLSLSVDCGVGGEGEGEWVGEGCIALGEVLSTGKVPSLRTVRLGWPCDQSFRSLCEGLSRGRFDPSVMVDICFWSTVICTDSGLNRFAEVIRAGKLSGLRQVTFSGYGTPSRGGGEAFGEALSHAESCMNSLEEMSIEQQTTEATSALLVGLSRGRGSLPALHTLKCPNGITITTEATQSLSTLMRGGKVPSLSDLRVSFPGAGQMGIQPFAAALSSPHVSTLRRLDVWFSSAPPAYASAAVGMLSAALGSGHLRRLEKLCVQNLRVIEEVRALCVGLGSGRLSSLHTLQLWGCRLGVDGSRTVSEVVVAEKLPSLTNLELQVTYPTDEGVRALTEG